MSNLTEALQVPSVIVLWPILERGYLGRMFGPMPAKTLIWRDILHLPAAEGVLEYTFSEILHRMLEYSAPGLPRSFSIPRHALDNPRCNAVSTDGVQRIVIDYKVPNPDTARIVPQQRWAPYGGARHLNVAMELAGIIPSLFFVRPDLSIGLPLAAAKSAVHRDLFNHGWQPLPDKTSIRLRILWYGYQPWDAQIQLRNTGAREPIPLVTLVRRIATSVEKYILSDRVPSGDHGQYPQWHIGTSPNEISAANVVLVGAVAVSQGSIMPIIQLIC